jgi:hypothetical protein
MGYSSQQKQGLLSKLAAGILASSADFQLEIIYFPNFAVRCPV